MSTMDVVTSMTQIKDSMSDLDLTEMRFEAFWFRDFEVNHIVDVIQDRKSCNRNDG